MSKPTLAERDLLWRIIWAPETVTSGELADMLFAGVSDAD